MNRIEKIGMSKEYFFDTYAFFEIIRGNPNYKPYVESSIVTTIFNLAELNRNLRKEKDKKSADDLTEKYSRFLVDVTIDDIKKAMDLKGLHKHLSIPDAIGYCVAMRLGLKFLTGDRDFEGLVNVEFVK